MALGDAELCDRYEALYPGAVADSLDELGANAGRCRARSTG
jgi:hypothetical protein